MPIDISTIEVPDSIREVLAGLARHVDFERSDDKGANGHTFFGLNKLLDRKIVVKFYYWGGERETFAEPERLAKLRCPAVLPIYDAAPVDDDWAYFITQFCEKGDADQYLEGHQIGLRAAIDASLHVLSGISYLHSNGFVHRDLKPSNIFVDASNNFLIGDFGSVKKLTDEWTTNHSQHSLLYRPPEVFSEPRYHRTGDIYQAGIVLYQLLGGLLPYRERAYLNKKQLAEYDGLTGSVEKQLFAKQIIEGRIIRAKILDLATLPPWVPSQLKTVIRTATRPLFKDRYQTASEMSVALGRCRNGALPWVFDDGILTLQGDTQFRIVSCGDAFSVEKRRTGAWRGVREARGLTLEAAVRYVESL